MEKIKLKREDFIELHHLLTKRTGDRFEIEESAFGGIWFSGLENELFLKSNYGKSLVISRIHFEKKRSGIGTDTFFWLKNWAKQQDFNKIIIESTLTIEMNRFAEKHGFEKIEHQGIIINGEFFGNYELSL